ncbi:TAT-variant-translocated molybdopterin oxidoreductase [Flavobacteriaceae bacterium]|nr:TAT-variant-translocated molybdopterin oxidoreductase [Flavobacteriaceae bacterium]
MSSNKNKKYWKNLAELDPLNNNALESLEQQEFVEEIPVDEFLGDDKSLSNSSTSRRDFLKFVGFSTAAASLAACEGPVIKSIPYVVQPEEIIPGVANYYATTIANGYDFANVLIKTREGRPIKVESNKLAPISASANARVQASVLDLYDSFRLANPLKNQVESSWTEFNNDTKKKLNSLKNSSKSIILLTQTFASPTTNKLINEFKKNYSNVKHIIYDSISESAALNAYEAKYGLRGLANYDFSMSDLIISVGADILGDWQGGGFDSNYGKSRIPVKGQMSRHVHFEANMSLTGANADNRYPVNQNDQKLVLLSIYSKLFNVPASIKLTDKLDKVVIGLMKELLESNNPVVVSGIQDVEYQSLVLDINQRLNSNAFQPEKTILTRQGNDNEVEGLINDMNNSKVGAIIMAGVNPVYTLPNSNSFIEGLKKTEMSVLFSMKNDETALYVNYLAATPHYLESWGDTEMTKGEFSITQPTIRPIFDTKQFQEVLLSWNNDSISYHDYLKSNWQKNILKNKTWNQALHDGVFEDKSSIKSRASFIKNKTNFSGSISALASYIEAKSENTFELNLYPKTGMGDGQCANNPWLQEFPDPITRTTWDNYLTVSEADAKRLNLYLEPSTFFTQSKNGADGGLNGKYSIISLDGTDIKVPVMIQPGQAQGTVGLSLGYGRNRGVKEVMMTGVNGYKLFKNFKSIQSIKIMATDEIHEFACVQLHNTLMGRGDVIKETNLEIFNTKNSNVWNPEAVVSLNHVETPVSSPSVDLWDEFDRSIGHHFNLSIDLNACTGCGACVIACHAENNVPVVGKEEIRKSRDMHWLRIDRYYSSEDSFESDDQKKDDINGLASSLSTFGEMENPSENPQVAFQPIMCQHCNHAPCETVCPVAATTHGRQGQNQMTYNRCVGTRYCANNCPYKVRRFNWFLYNENDEFDYHMNDDLGRMVLNPDVTVRSRGVMEKCSFCIQATQSVILKAKLEGREVKEGEFNDKVACAAACSSGAMKFGDINENDSEIYRLKQDDRAYHLLDTVGTKPNVVYQVKVRNNKNS